MGQPVICPKCGMENPVSNRFCGACGIQFFAHCPYCGFDYHPRYKYCGNCGKRIAGELNAITETSRINFSSLLTRIENMNNHIAWRDTQLLNAIAGVEGQIEKVIGSLQIQTKTLLELVKKYSKTATPE